MNFIGKLALTGALFMLAPFNSVVASETTSGDHGQGYILASEGTMCYNPSPVDDGDSDTASFERIPYAFLDYGEPITFLPQQEMYFGWLLVSARGEACLIEQGSAQSGPSPLSVNEVIVSDEPVDPELVPEPETVEAEVVVTPEAPRPQPSVSVEAPTSHTSEMVAVVQPTAPTEDPITVRGLPNTGSGEVKKALRTGHAVAIFFSVMASSLAYATFKERREQVDTLLGKVRDKSPRVFNVIATLLLVPLSPVIATGVVTYAIFRAAYIVAEMIFLLTVCHWPEREQKSERRERRATVLIR